MIFEENLSPHFLKVGKYQANLNLALYLSYIIYYWKPLVKLFNLSEPNPAYLMVQDVGTKK